MNRTEEIKINFLEDVFKKVLKRNYLINSSTLYDMRRLTLCSDVGCGWGWLNLQGHRVGNTHSAHEFNARLHYRVKVRRNSPIRYEAIPNHRHDFE